MLLYVSIGPILIQLMLRGFTSKMTPTTNPISQLHINEEYQDLIPPLTTQEYNALKINIKDNGQRIPIIVSNRTGELVVIDGHHRYKISQELEREPQFEIGYFESETEELEYIRDCNIEGRNLNIVQKVHVILKTEDKLIEIAKKNSHAKPQTKSIRYRFTNICESGTIRKARS